MANVRCPMCGKSNPEELDECQYCGARLKPVTPSSPINSQTLKPGEQPVKRDTSEFEKAKLSGTGSIHPGEAPTKKDTGELERALPSWLRSLREGKPPAEGESLAEPSSDEGLDAASQATPASDLSSGLPDWLSGLDKAAAEDEEVPDWLTGLRGGSPSEPAATPAFEEEPAADLGNEDWMQRLGSDWQEPKPEPPDTAKLPPLDLPVTEPAPEPPLESNLPDWLQKLQTQEPAQPEPPVAQPGGENLPDWLSGLSALPSESGPALSGTEEPAPAEGKPSWLDQLNQKPFPPETGAPAEETAPAPDWLSSFGSVPAAPAAPLEDNVPDWLSNLESKSEPESGAPAALPAAEPPAAALPPAGTPAWLSQLQAEADAAKELEKHQGELGGVPEAPVSPDSTGPLPDWLAGLEQTALPPAGSSPLIEENSTASAQAGETAFSIEAPDWLSKLTPDQEPEKVAENKAGQAAPGKLETADLPSWVQAMRPVEAVVESKTTALEEDQVTELSGPLAGLRGVLPAGPGLGPLRKPPVYSSKLQVSDGQQRYAASLEQLVMGESHPRAVARMRLPANRVWRWWIAALLILAVALPFASSAHFAPPTLLLPSDKGASSKIIAGLPANVPVLVAFDYDPALSGELEAVAAPIMDQLLSKGTPLALISTSPTGPALAEHFLETTLLVNVYQYQNQYVNLGYLAGGPAGILYLAEDLTSAVPVSVEGKPAWETGPLQGIQSISNFAALIILTDNADTGRNWIEQAGPRLGNTPMLMVISTQAEPMVRPYFDSGQLKGLVSGLSDAKSYEQTYNRPGLANRYWNSFSVGMLVAELLILAVAILGVMADRRVAHKDTKEGA